MTEREFAECVAFLTSSIGKPMSAEMAKAWFEILSDLTLGQLKAGIVTTCREYTFAGFPPVGVILKNALGGSGAKSLEVQRSVRSGLGLGARWDASVRGICNGAVR